MRKDYVCSAALILALSIVLIMSNKANGAEGNKMNVNKNVAMSVCTYEELSRKLESVELPKQEEKPERPQIKDIPLSEDILEYLWNKSQESGLAYTYLLALAETESEFNPKEQSQTNDFGLFQIHKPTDKWIADQLGIKNYNLYNPFTNIDFAVFYLTYLRDYWRSQGASGEEEFELTTISFNRGIEGCKSYLKHHDFDDNAYLRSVKKNKYEIEQNEVLE
jgi:hypothetical protein